MSTVSSGWTRAIKSPVEIQNNKIFVSCTNQLATKLSPNITKYFDNVIQILPETKHSYYNTPAQCSVGHS